MEKGWGQGLYADLKKVNQLLPSNSLTATL